MTKIQDFQYLKLTKILTELIGNGTYKEGSRLPSERELCRDYSLSRTTVRQAMQELIQGGYVTSIQGRGTFVSKPPIKQDLLRIYSFDDDMRRMGKNPETEVLDFLGITADEKLAKLFGVAIGEPLYRVFRLRAADGEPMLLETNYLLASRFSDLSGEMVKGQSLYNLLINKYNLKLSLAEETFAPVLLRYMEAKLLCTTSNALGMLVER
ncbi:MAG: GntR family transcriptional regulator, partial [Clostridiaceae bacterium]